MFMSLQPRLLSASFWANVLASVLLLASQDVNALGTQDSMRDACTRELDIASLFLEEVPAFATHNAVLCSSDRNNPVLFYASKHLCRLSNHQTGHGTSLIFLPLLARDEPSGDKPPRLPAGLLSVIGDSITTAIMFAVWQGRYVSKRDQQQHGRSALQTSQSLLVSLPRALLATTLLFALGLSFRVRFLGRF
jgi:hypothetical protein